MPPEGTIEISNILFQFTKDCDCEIDDEDECLLLVDADTALRRGSPVCEQCQKPYSWDSRAIVTKMQ
jgi:hypothetical protein